MVLFNRLNWKYQFDKTISRGESGGVCVCGGGWGGGGGVNISIIGIKSETWVKLNV